MKNAKKIAVLIDRLNVSGVEKIAIEEVKALRSLGIDVTLLVLTRKAVVKEAFSELRKDMPTIYLDDRLPKLFRFTFKFPVFYFFSFFHLSYPFLIPFVIKENEFDYIIAHSTYTCFTAVSIKKFRHIQFSAFIWDPIGYILQQVYKNKFPGFLFYPLLFLAKYLDGIIAKNADYVLVGGTAHNKYLSSVGARLKVTPPSVHPVPRPTSEKENYVLTLTAWKRGKNPEYLADIVQAMPAIHIKMVGNWAEKAYLKEFKEFINEKKIDGNIEIVGGVSEDLLMDYYAKACVLLQINDDRGFGMPPLEAAGCATTFIIPQGQGVCALFKNNIDGFYTKERDTKTIITDLKKLLDNKTLAVRMGTHAWKTVRENYSWQNHAKGLAAIIDE